MHQINLPASHPFADAVRQANIELAMGSDVGQGGNQGRVRVCARRAVGIFLQTITPQLPVDYGSNAMANLRGLQEDPLLPDEIRSAAERLLGGARSINVNQLYSVDPLADAMVIIRYFLELRK